MLRGAFVGFGNVAADAHLPAWQSRNDVVIVAAADAIAARSRVFRQACPAGVWYDNIEALLSHEALDFVDICTPPSSHAAHIRQALAAGLHVVCEKPLVTCVADAQLITAAAASAGRVVHTVHNWLKAPACRKVSALLGEAAIGTVRSVCWRTTRTEPAVSVRTNADSNWRLDPALAGGGILVDHGWHALYCITHWAGPPRAIAALLERRRFHEWPIEDTATVSLDLISGSGQIHLTWAGKERSNHIQIAGERGCIIVANGDLVLKTNSDERRWAFPSLSEGSHHRDWFTDVAEEFLNAVTAGGTNNLDDAVLCARLIDLAQRSSANGGVHLPVGV